MRGWRTPAFVVLLTIVAVLAGCGEEQETAAGSAAADTQQPTADEHNRLSATLTAFSGSTMEVIANDTKYVFDVSDAQLETASLVTGDAVVVTYDGELDASAPMSDVTVQSVADEGDASTEQEENQVVGVLVSQTLQTVTLKRNDGVALTFAIGNCEMLYENGMQPGNWIVLTYQGTIDAEETTGVHVTHVTDNDAQVIGRAQKNMRFHSALETVYAAADSTIYASACVDSAAVGLIEAGETVICTGRSDNGWCRMLYNGQEGYLYESNVVSEQPVQPLVQQTDDVPADSGDPVTQTQQQVVCGTVRDAAMRTLTVDVDGIAYTLPIERARQQYRSGLHCGNTVRITYTGELGNLSNLCVIEVEDDDPYTAAQAAEFTGTVQGTTRNTLTLRTQDGADLTFLTEQAQDYADGETVAVTADVSDSGADSNFIIASAVQRTAALS